MSIEVTVEYAHREWNYYDNVVHIRNYQQLQAKVAELEEEIDRLESESEEYAQLQSRCFDGGGSHASVFDEVSELRAQLAAAQEEIQRMKRERLLTADAIESMHASHKDQLAKAEQRVAEACALQVATETKFHWLDAARVAKEIRSGEWRKFVKEGE